VSFKLYLEYEARERAGAMPVYKDEDGKYYVALMKPSDPKYGGTAYQVAKGQIDTKNGKKESPEETAVKEVWQELGIKIKESDLIKIWNRNKMMFFYIAKVKNKNSSGPQPNEHGQIETESIVWWDLDTAEKKMRDWQRPLVKEVREALGIKNES